MIESWWAAHQLEFLVCGVIFVALGVMWLLISVVEIRRERRKQRRDGLR